MHQKCNTKSVIFKKMSYINPFPILDYYSPDYFCNREKELETLLNAYKNNRNVTLISIRRLGKTGLIKHLFHHIKQNKFKTPRLLYFDILLTENISDFIREFGNKLIEIESKNANWFKKISKLISGINATISIDEKTGVPSLQFAYKTPQESEQSLSKIFAYLTEQKQEYLIAIDEFQQIVNYPEKNVEAILRTHIQHQHKDRYIFSGSSKHILISMFNDYGRPFYASSEMLNLNRLDIDEYSNFIVNLFAKAKKKIEFKLVKEIVEYLDVHTFYVQYFFNKLYDINEKNINEEHIDLIKNTILKEKEYVYLNYKNILTSLQFNLLKAIAKEKILEKPNSSVFLRKYNFTQASSVNKALKYLLQKEMIYYENNVYKVYDVFLSKWLETLN